MKHFKLVVLMCFLSGLLRLIACGGSSSNTPVPPPETSATLIDAKTKLASGDIEGAYDTYSAVIGDGLTASVGKAIETDNAEARFGRALTGIILLIERAPVTSVLTSFGQRAWSVNTVLGESGFLFKSLTNPHPDMRALPFHGLCRPYKRCILKNVKAGYTPQDIASSLDELTAYIDPIINDLLIAIKDTGAAYTIPKELYSGDVDIKIHHADMVQMLAGMYLAEAASDFANSWSFTMDLSKIVDSNAKGLLTGKEGLDQLNDQFELRADNRLSNARTNLQKWTTYSKQALTEVLAGSSGGVLNLSETNKVMYQEFFDMVESVDKSFSSTTQIVDIVPAVTANLDNFFNFPPNKPSSCDLFVAEGGSNCLTEWTHLCKVKAVESCWDNMVQKALPNFVIANNHKTFVFNDAVRLVPRRYYQLFNTIIGHYFGRYQAGHGS